MILSRISLPWKLKTKAPATTLPTCEICCQIQFDIWQSEEALFVVTTFAVQMPLLEPQSSHGCWWHNSLGFTVATFFGGVRVEWSFLCKNCWRSDEVGIHSHLKPQLPTLTAMSLNPGLGWCHSSSLLKLLHSFFRHILHPFCQIVKTYRAQKEITELQCGRQKSR